MKKAISLLVCLCILCICFNACSNENQEVVMEKFEQQTVIYKNKIQDVDPSLEITESTHACQDGDHIVVFSVETRTKACFGVTLTVNSSKKAILLIEFNDAGDNWTADNLGLFASFISELTNYELPFYRINNAIDVMSESNYHRFSLNASLSWDDYHSTLYYTETFQIDSVS